MEDRVEGVKRGRCRLMVLALGAVDERVKRGDPLLSECSV